jgi:hypothetical protein
MIGHVGGYSCLIGCLVHINGSSKALQAEHWSYGTVQGLEHYQEAPSSIGSNDKRLSTKCRPLQVNCVPSEPQSLHYSRDKL